MLLLNQEEKNYKVVVNGYLIIYNKASSSMKDSKNWARDVDIDFIRFIHSGPNSSICLRAQMLQWIILINNCS